MTPVTALALCGQLLCLAEPQIPPSQAAVQETTATTSTLRHRDLFVDGLRLHVVEAGEPSATRPSIVLLHGWMASAATFVPVQTQLAKTFHVVAIDAPGHGQSYHPARQVTSLYMAQVTHAALEKMQLKRPIIVGESMGGMTAMRIAERWPESLSALILANPAGFDPGVLRQIGMRFLLQPSMYDSSPDWPFVMVMHMVCMDYGDVARADLAELQQRRRNPRWAFAIASAYKDIRSGVLNQIAPKMHSPTTLLLGSADLAFPKPYQQQVKILLPEAKLIVVEGAGHGLHNDAPDVFIQTIKQVAKQQ